MSHDVLIIIAIVGSILAMTILRVNAAMIFLSLCLGSVLVQYVASQANDMLRLFVPSAGDVSASTVQLILMLAPALLTAVLMVFSIHGKLKVLLNALPAAAASALAVLLAAPLLPPELKESFGAPHVWQLLSKSSALIVGVGAVMSLLFLWTQRSSFKHHDKRRR